ncbi:MAG: hypothetical protein Q7V58_08370 [Actinomycetota bacterium]|nr:hypothetical protein [Actinomycetota bacterium]
MSRDRGAALSGFLQFLSGNPDGDAATRSAVVGALGPLGAIAGQVYGIGRPDTLELIGNFGYPGPDAAAFRTIVTSLPLPIADAFTTARTIATLTADLPRAYPLLASGTEEAPEEVPGVAAEEIDTRPTRLVCVPVLWLESPVGILSVLLDDRELGADDYQYLEGVASALALWFLEQRRALIDRWRRAAPLPHREFTITARQHRILELIGQERTNTDIANVLGYSIPTVKKDLQEIMKLLGTQDRRTTAGRAREIGLLPDRRARD